MATLFRREALSREKSSNQSNRIDTRVRRARNMRLTGDSKQVRPTEMARARLKRQMTQAMKQQEKITDKTRTPDNAHQAGIAKKIILDSDVRRGNNRLKEAFEKGDISKEEAQKLTKLQKSKERMANQIHRMTASAAEKDIASDLQQGRTVSALHEARGTGREGAVGNTVSDNSGRLASSVSDLSRLAGKYAGDTMRQILKANTTAADQMNGVLADKDPDRHDQNKEGRQTQDTTQKQVMDERLRRLRGGR